MLTKKKLLSQLIVVAVGGTAAHHVHAEAYKEPVTLQKVTVTAQKREETAQEVPTPITVLGGEDLLDSGIGKGAAEVLSYVPNASAGTQQHGRPRWWIRGVGTGVQSFDSPNPVGIYFDDVYIGNASSTGGPLFDLDRVEVLRGPQGTLWGKNTTGGAINFISKKPSFTPDGYLKLDYGTNDDKTIEGAFGGPIRGEQLAARGSFHYESTDGRFNNQYTGEKGGVIEDSAFRVQLLGEVTPDLETLLNIHFRRYTNDGATATVTGTGVNGAYRNGYIPAEGINSVATNAANTSDAKQNGVLLNLKWQLGTLSFTSITGYEDYIASSLTDSDNTPLEISRGWTDATSRQFSQEFRLASPREDRWNWVTGLHYFHETIDSESSGAKLPAAAAAISVPGNPTYNNTDFLHKTTSYAAFGNTTYNFTDALALTLGLRWTSEDKKLDWQRRSSANASFNNTSEWWRLNSLNGTLASATADKDESWNDWTWDVTPEYKFNDHLRAYARIAKGFRSGGYNTAATSQLAIDQIVDPEYLTSYEIGVKSEWFDGRLNANANVFKYTYDDIQVNVVGPLPTSQGASVSYLQNVKEGKASGAEFEIEALPIENLHVNASLGILNTKFTDFGVPGGFDSNGNPTSVLDYSGNRFVRSPHYSGVLGVDYSIPLWTGGKLVLGTDWKYQSKQYYFTTNQNDPLLGSSGYALGNARVSYVSSDGKITTTGYVKNVSDKEYLNHALPGTAGATGDTSIWGDPRTVGVSLTTRW